MTNTDARPTGPLSVVTGAFGFSGKYITRRLLAQGHRVRTLTGHPGRENPFGDSVEIAGLDLDDPQKLREALAGADTVYNTYWVRFSYGRTSHQLAVENSKALVSAAQQAAVRRFVHLSITSPSLQSPLPYFRGKAEVEQAVLDSGLSYAILRPAVIFAAEDILINNIAWLLRRFPLFMIPGSGKYRIQPIFAEDLAILAVQAGQRSDNFVIDAVGPETYTYEELVRLIARAVGSRARIVHAFPGLVVFLARILGLLVHDVLLTTEEVQGLMADLLVSQAPSTGWKKLSEWLEQNANHVGVNYASELKRHYAAPHAAGQ